MILNCFLSQFFREMTDETAETHVRKPTDKPSPTFKPSRKRAAEIPTEAPDRKVIVLKTLKIHGCQFCGKEFNNKSNYNRHVKQMHLN